MRGRKSGRPIPPYTFDVHTRKGKKYGRTKDEFFRDEYQALQPRVIGLFDDLVPPSATNLFSGSDEKSEPL